MIKRIPLIILGMALVLLPFMSSAQGELAAVLEVRAAGVEVQRVNTDIWIPVNVEAIVGVGDTIRTDESGSARIIFFADGTDTDLLPQTEYRIEEFAGDDSGFTLRVSVLAGQTTQRLNRIIDDNSSYDVQTPAMEMVARGTTFRIRVEDDGRAAMLVDEGVVGAIGDESEADVPPAFGIRAAVGDTLSDVVAATNFDELDAALDGCSVDIGSVDDIQLNVRLGPSLDFPRVGTIAPAEIDIFIGQLADGSWYRIEFADNFGWVLASDVSVEGSCAGLRQFPADYGGEDPALYGDLGIEFDLSDFTPPAPPSDEAEAEETDDAEAESESE